MNLNAPLTTNWQGDHRRRHKKLKSGIKKIGVLFEAVNPSESGFVKTKLL